MKILVCIKQVPDPEASIVIDHQSRWILEDDWNAFFMNRYDEYALEEAVLIKERLPEVMVDVISVGPARARATIKKAIEKGADRGFHVLPDQGPITSDETASFIASHARGEKYDLILTGVMSEDMMQGQVGPMIAAMLGIPCAVSVLREHLDLQNETITVFSELEGGMQEEIVLCMPCLISIQSGINRPRYPSLSNVLRAKNMEPILVEPDPEVQNGAGQAVRFVSYPAKADRGIVIEGALEEKADSLLDILHEKAILSFVTPPAEKGGG